ncbi:hypothetical protein F4813DRAFT_350074 [Daldinia decipiens]|uniref:uncharacterized protein n=1 Tax=Daldinia decipiens TaxID=326647 RepID=UPI0020C2CB4E|nr:uncharacterized protein F4813DRAFT_350074 [Daldinia decipiens]KAI1660479.1 hypothetical protein F4813DRAFT_350074 [Daldinia decipiens]
MTTLIGGRTVNALGVSPSTDRKKRLACDNCHLSKVRCTGELSGCQRCERGNKTCHYSQSNMGRTSADRASRRRKSSVPKTMGPYITSPTGSHQQQQQLHDWNSSNSLSSGVGDVEQQIEQNGLQFPSSSVERNYSLHHHNRSASDSMSILDEATSQEQRKHSVASMSLDNIGDELQGPSFDPLISNFEDIDFSDIDDNYFEVIGTRLELTFPRLITSHQSPRASPSRQQQPQPQQQQLHTTQLFGTSSSTTTTSSYQGHGSEQTPGTPHSSGGDVNYWTTQLEELSRRPHKSPMPLDEVLHQSSQLLPRVTEVLRALSLADPLSSTHMILILVCLTQVITFFEQCMPSVICGLENTGSSGDLSLHLGAYQVDREVQQALQMHIVGKELSTVLQVSKLIKQTLLQPDWNSVSKRTHDLLLEDLQVRTKTLMYQIKQKWSSARHLAL